MLKIKDSVDMKILEDYGFTYHKGMTPAIDENGKIIKYHKLKPNGEYTKKEYTKFVETKGSYIYKQEEYYSTYEYIIDERDRSIMMMIDTNIPDDNYYDLDILYFLIKDDLVEQVED